MNSTMTRPFMRLGAALAVLVALALAPLRAPAASPAYLNAGEALAVYEAADAASGVLRQLLPQEAFELLGSAPDWASVRVFTESGEMAEGWVKNVNLRPRTPEDGYRHAVIAPESPDERPALRIAPRSNADSLGRYYPGVLARVLAQPDNGGVKLGIGTLEGYMPAEALAFDPLPGSVADLLPQVSVAYQDGPSLTMRGAQSFKSDKIGAYRNGTQVRVLGFTDDFAQVLAPDGKLGFMMAWGLDPQPFAAAPADPLPLPGKGLGVKAPGPAPACLHAARKLRLYHHGGQHRGPGRPPAQQILPKLPDPGHVPQRHPGLCAQIRRVVEPGMGGWQDRLDDDKAPSGHQPTMR